MFRRPLAALLALLLGSAAHAGEVQVAVAANFTAPMKEIAAAFAQHTGHRAWLSFGSSGQFFAQIQHGAPFEVFLSADDMRPRRLVEAGAALADSQFTYAQGQLVLWSSDAGLIQDESVLQGGHFAHIAIANPKSAPYGAAALEVMDRLGVSQSLLAKRVQSENIAQCYQFVASGNAELGFVARSQVLLDGQLTRGSGWAVPGELHSPIRQDAVLLKRGEHNPAARALLDYLQSAEARAVIRRYGYRVD